MTRHSLSASLAASFVVVALTAASAAQSGAPQAALEQDLNRIREATRPFHDMEAAQRAGYPSMLPQCIENQPEGGMGHHYTHAGYMDDKLELEKPEILVYAPTRNAKPRFAGVEYVVPYSAWTKTEAPRILGQSLKRSDSLQIWYLHVWLWEANEKGIFADWNPSVSCKP